MSKRVGRAYARVEPRNVLPWLVEQSTGNDQNKELVPLILREQSIRTSRRPSSTKWHCLRIDKWTDVMLDI